MVYLSLSTRAVLSVLCLSNFYILQQQTKICHERHVRMRASSCSNLSLAISIAA